MELILSEESLNRYGTRVMTKGIDLTSFKKNPVMFYNHDRSRLPIGKWENISKNATGALVAKAVFDNGDVFATEVSRKLEAGFLNSCSVGILVLATSSEPSLMLAGQQYATITKCELLEVSVVDVPANANAVKLYQKDTKGNLMEFSFVDLVATDAQIIQENNLTEKKMETPPVNAVVNAVVNAAAETTPEQAIALILEANAQEITSLKQEFKQELAALKAEIETLKNKPPTAVAPAPVVLSAEGVIAAFRANHSAKDVLLEKLALHPEKSYDDWFFEDHKFLHALKSAHPAAWEKLEAGK